jgi:hypothetical protein
MTFIKTLLLSVLLSFSLTVLSCDFIFPESEYGSDFDPFGFAVEQPTVSTGDIELVRYPDLWTLGAYYCPIVFNDFLLQKLCQVTLGSVPPNSELIFRFQLPLTVHNPNTFAIPAVELLTALSVFPAEERQQLAAVCIGFCDEGDLACLDASGNNLCTSDEPEIRSIDDFAQAALGYLSIFIESRLNNEVPPELRVKMIPPESDGFIVITFEIHPDPLLEALEIAFFDHLEEIIDDENVTVVIPYDVEGTLWFVVENFGRFGVGFGPVEGEWRI